MTVGEFVDFIIEWNRMNNPDQEEENKPTRRKATQADIDAFWG